MIKNLFNIKTNGISVCINLLLVVLLLPLSIDDGRYILLSLFSVAYLIWLFVARDSDLKLPKIKYLAPMALFGLLALASTLWAQDTSQVLRHSFIWSVFLIFILVISMHQQREEQSGRLVAKLFSFIFVLFLIIHLGALNFEIALNEEWNQLMSRGKNYSTTLLTVLSPYLLFYPSRSQFIRFVKIISIVLLSNILFLTGARGAMLAFSVIVLIKLWNFYSHTSWRILGGIGGLAVIITGIYLLNTSQATSDFRFVNEYRQELEPRVRVNKNSIKSISENPLLGAGAGHWARDIYRHGIGNVAPLNNSKEVTRFRSHNAYFMMAVEYGLIGFVLFFLPIVLSLLRYRHRWTELDGIKKAAWTSLLAWLIVIFFYATAVPYSYFFSGIALVGLTGYALILPYSDIKSFGSRYVIIIPTVLAVACGCWFSFSKVCHSTYQKANKAYENGNSMKAYELYEQLYHPTFFASADYSVSIDQRLAELVTLQGDNVKAAFYYERGLEIMPNSSSLLYSYLIFLRENSPESARLTEIELRLRNIQPNLI